ncbi:hypothetical protein PMIN06_004738 [Paraphaeosphaeria minitans]
MCRYPNHMVFRPSPTSAAHKTSPIGRSTPNKDMATSSSHQQILGNVIECIRSARPPLPPPADIPHDTILAFSSAPAHYELKSLFQSTRTEDKVGRKKPEGTARRTHIHTPHPNASSPATRTRR